MKHLCKTSSYLIILILYYFAALVTINVLSLLLLLFCLIRISELPCGKLFT